MGDLYRHDIELGESPDAYMRMKWLRHHRYLVSVEPVGTLTVAEDESGRLWIDTPHTLAPGRYTLVPEKADDE